MRLFLCLTLAFSINAWGVPRLEDAGGVERANELKAFISKEKDAFQERETQRRDVMSELDKLNADQNKIRQRLSEIEANQQELVMAKENLSVEFEKQKTLEAFEKKRLTTLFKVVYRIKKDGLIKFLFHQDPNQGLASRIRVLYRSLRSHSLVTRQLEERAKRLKASEQRLAQMGGQVEAVMQELGEQQEILNKILDRKKTVLNSINKKQNHYQLAVKEYKQISTQLAALFDDFESERDDDAAKYFPSRNSLPLPVETGRMVKGFGKLINEKFGTVTYHKGIEIEAPQNTPVKAILAGKVEYEGWVKGLGNVLIIHHGGGFYSLSAHLFKALKGKDADVTQGETIGLVGDTGENEKPSLYFEIRENNKAVNPLAYFNSRLTG